MEAKEEIKLKLDIADLIGEYLPLKPAGSAAFKGLCPFHSERTPSFHVSRARQIWRCFGCDKGGDIFTFVMEMEGISFPEALRQLASKAGVTVPEFKPLNPDLVDKRERFYKIYAAAAQYYAAVLREFDFGAVARQYIATRGIDNQLRDKFQLGASPESWDSLSLTLKKQGFLESELVEAGISLARKSGSGVIDRFRNRLMIPICDAQGRVIAFTGRVIPGTVQAAEETGKYVNSPESILYKKGETLFGLHLAKTAIHQTGEVIIVEGNLDVIASHKAGIENVVASSGTALTEAQLRLLMRFTKRLVFCLDEDSAGLAAVKRVVDIALSLAQNPAFNDLQIRCLVIPKGAGKDPDEIIKTNPELWKKIAKVSFPVIEYFFQKNIALFEERPDSSSVESRRVLIDDLMPYLKRVTRPDERHLYLLRLSDATHVDLSILAAMAGKDLAQAASTATAPKRPTASASGSTPSSEKADSYDRVFAYLLGVAIAHSSSAGPILAQLSDAPIPERWKKLYDALKLMYTATDQSLSPIAEPMLAAQLRAYFAEQKDTASASLLDALLLRTDEILAGLLPNFLDSDLNNHFTLLHKLIKTQRQQALETEIRQAELSGNNIVRDELLKQYAELLKMK